MRRRWPIDAKKAAETVNELLNSPDERIQARAAAIAAVMEGQNQKDEHKVIDVRVQVRNDQLTGIAADLGIEVGAIADVIRQATGGDGDSDTSSE
ncbi:MAG: hypothetical protein ACKO0Z_10500 [Betaproteobacteria bacterium]